MNTFSLIKPSFHLKLSSIPISLLANADALQWIQYKRTARDKIGHPYQCYRSPLSMFSSPSQKVDSAASERTLCPSTSDDIALYYCLLASHPIFFYH
jgi:hypothetical protein